MRIVAGSLKGMRLVDDVSSATRPTSDSVRESIFNILQSRIDLDNKKVADLYAGTGALGIEAFSRGASEVIFIETDSNACSAIKKNISMIESKEKSDSVLRKLHVERMPVLTFVQKLQNRQVYDLVLADPPYVDDIETEVMSIITSGGYLVYETSAEKLDQCKEDFTNHPRTEEIIVSRKMGNVGLVIVRAN